jgi:hypothetical protein
MNERGREMSERLAWAVDLGIVPTGRDSSAKTTHSAVEAGADPAEWVDEGLAHIAELRDAMHLAVAPDSVPESPIERWQAEGQYLEHLAVSKRGLPPLSAWLKDHPDLDRELARSAPDWAGQRNLG